jgi:hypothetical protein
MQVAAFLPIARIYGSGTYLDSTGKAQPNPQAEIPKFSPIDYQFMMTANQ